MAVPKGHPWHDTSPKRRTRFCKCGKRATYGSIHCFSCSGMAHETTYSKTDNIPPANKKVGR